MTRLRKIASVLLASAIALAAVIVSIGLLGLTSVVNAQEPGPSVLAEMAPQAQPPLEPDFTFGVVFTDPAAVEIQDLSGNVVAQGVHEGKLSCNGDNCNQKTSLTFTPFFTDPAQIEYRFKSRQTIDPVAGRAVVTGIGVIVSTGQKERFSFTAAIQNNGDGSVSVRYISSLPEASLYIPQTRATFVISSRR